MKNIHILPTDKASKLASKDSNGKLEVSDKNTFFVNGLTIVVKEKIISFIP